MESLTIGNAKKLEGIKIKWSAPAYKGNHPYSGVSQILSVDEREERPLKTKTIEGDDLDNAFVDLKQYPLCFSDTDRYVTFEIYEK